MRVLVTGATGFIGGNVARKLIEAGFEVNALIRKGSNTLNIKELPLNIFTGDLRNKASLKRAVKGCKGLFHIAASYSFWSSNPGEFYEINVEGTKNIIKAAVEEGVCRIVYTSSESTIKVAGNGRLGNEDELNNLNDLAGDYKKSKLMAEKEVLRFCKNNYPIIIVNPTTPIGPGDVKPTPTGRIVLDFLNGKMPAYVNTGLNIIDVEDVAEGHILAFEKGKIGERYLLGNKNLTLKQMLEIIAGIENIKPPKVQIPLWLAMTAAYIDEFISGKILRRYPGIPLAAVKTAYKFRHFDCSKAVIRLGLPQTPVESAFEKSINWFRENGYVKN